MMQPAETSTYHRSDCVVFLKTHEAFGGLSNMAAGYPLVVNGVRILTAEALYQACRFPHLPEVQKLIVGQASPMAAKMKSKPYRKDSRSDWEQVNVEIMGWCLRVKLAQNWGRFGELLLSTVEKPIVEESKKDAFWGAKPTDAETLVGRNVLGKLLTELREQLQGAAPEKLREVEPLALPNFLFSGRKIGTVTASGSRLVLKEEQKPAQVEQLTLDI